MSHPPHTTTPTSRSGARARTDVSQLAAPGDALQAPLGLIQLAGSDEGIRRQVEALVAAGDESRRCALVFAREVMRQVPSEFLADALDDNVAFGPADPDAMVGPAGGPVELRPGGLRVGPRPPRTMQVNLPQQQPEVPLSSLTANQRCWCCDEAVGTGDNARCAVQARAQASRACMPRAPRTRPSWRQVCGTADACDARA